jgi:O-antigen/teichoic acid export membrane protein
MENRAAFTEVQNPNFDIQDPQSEIQNPKSKIQNSPWLRRGKLLSRFMSVQAAVQAMGVASGILLVRSLSKPEYAYVTLAFSMQSTMSILADSGISISLSSIGGRVWQDRGRFGQLINTALRLRRYLAAIAVIAVTPILVWLLIRSGAPRLYAVVITVTVLVGLNYQLLSGVLMIVPRLHSQIKRLQTLDALAAAVRLVLLVAAYFIFLNAAVAIWATVVSVIVQYGLLNRWASEGIDKKAEVNKEDQSAMLGIVRHQAPNAVFYCVQGQLTVWLISVFGNTQSIAEIGALGRLGVMFSVIGAVMTSILLPRFSRCQEPSELRRQYWQILGGALVFGVCLVIPALIAPKAYLWILGAKYSHLSRELPLIVSGSALGSVGAVMQSLNAAKGWVKYYWLNIPCIIVLQALLIWRLDLSIIYDVLLFGVISGLPGIIFSAAITWTQLFRNRLAG